VLLVRPGVACPVEVYMIRREKSMRFLGGFYAFPGGKVEPTDGSADALARCRGISSVAALAAFPAADGIPPLAFWVTAARELVEETGLLVGCDADGRPVDLRDPAVRDRVERLRHALVGEEAPFHVLLGREGWYLDPLHRALLPGPRAGGTGAASARRRSVRGFLDRSRRGSPSLPRG
jgi:8-oxo-dGTP pyrophosphatase MutT (NUDIX family)